MCELWWFLLPEFPHRLCKLNQLTITSKYLASHAGASKPLSRVNLNRSCQNCVGKNTCWICVSIWISLEDLLERNYNKIPLYSLHERQTKDLNIIFWFVTWKLTNEYVAYNVYIPQMKQDRRAKKSRNFFLDRYSYILIYSVLMHEMTLVTLLFMV